MSKDTGGPAFPALGQRKFLLNQVVRCKGGHEYPITQPMLDRKSYRCPKCAAIAAVEYARQNREAKRAWNNAYSAKTSGKRAGSTAKWRAAHPEKRAAHQAVQSATRSGRLERRPCEVCGSETRIHAHHDDYGKPLDVRWLCHQHHMQRHAMLAERNKE